MAPDEVLNQPENVNIDNSLANFHLTLTTIMTSISMLIIFIVLFAFICICLRWRLCQGCCYQWCCECCLEPRAQAFHGSNQEADRAAESILTEPSRPTLAVQVTAAMSDEDQHEIGPGKITDFRHGCCFAMTTIVLIVLAAVVTIFCMEARAPCFSWT